ncbi:hypothetical protein DSO57_1020655 [Entomophthora muscae]|uniref:Uncharacterized protein n=1 Tax=Entomophthora muscae TaxID=34485 RepID=A0ACC2TR55_9FUNG|nr:hypothetical protein DSO57_1020655 [Entomophthora muscae]
MSQLATQASTQETIQLDQGSSPAHWKTNPAERQAILDYLKLFGKQFPILSSNDVYHLLTYPDDNDSLQAKQLLIHHMELAKLNIKLVQASLYTGCIEYINSKPAPDGRYFLVRFILMQSICYYHLLSTL